MSPKKYKVLSEPLDFEMVETSFESQSGNRRGAAAIFVNISGFSISNVEGGEEITDYLSDLGIDVEKAHLKYGVNRAKGLIALYGLTEPAAGSMAVKYDRAKKVYHFHMGGVFKQYPTLRPTTRVEVFFEAIVDAKGKPCLSLKLKGALPKRRGPSDDGEGEEEENAEAEVKAEAKGKTKGRKGKGNGKGNGKGEPQVEVAATEETEQ